MHFQHRQDGLYQPELPTSFPACKEAELGGALDPGVSDQEKIVMKLRVVWGHASAQHMKLNPSDADGDNQRLLARAGEV